jgi:hypothetical protein
MFQLACWANACLVLPFALACLAAPKFVFEQFGIAVEGAATGVARGYAATALGWGITAFLMRNVADVSARWAFLLGSIAFNTAEIALQVPMYFQGLANKTILMTIFGHAACAALSIAAITNENRTQRG